MTSRSGSILVSREGIIGVVDDSLYEGPREGVRRQVFVSNWGRTSATFYVRTTNGSAGAFSLLRNEVKQLDSSVPDLRDEDARSAIGRNAAYGQRG
jgi:hypothetical protein